MAASHDGVPRVAALVSPPTPPAAARRHRHDGRDRPRTATYGLARVILPLDNRKHVDEDLGDDLRRVVDADYGSAQK